MEISGSPIPSLPQKSNTRPINRRLVNLENKNKWDKIITEKTMPTKTKIIK
jgi:hypothetical protein